MLIKGKLVTLRPPELTDMELLNRWSNDPDIWRNLGGWHFPYSTRSTRQWIESRKDDDPADHVFCIDTDELGLIGTVSLVNIDWKDGNAFYGTQLGDKDVRGKGLAVDACFAIMRYAFDELRLNRLDGSVIALNERALTFITEKCGWKVEGIQREWYFREGRHHDRIIVGITKKDYQQKVSELRYWD